MFADNYNYFCGNFDKQFTRTKYHECNRTVGLKTEIEFAYMLEDVRTAAASSTDRHHMPPAYRGCARSRPRTWRLKLY